MVHTTDFINWLKKCISGGYMKYISGEYMKCKDGEYMKYISWEYMKCISGECIECISGEYMKCISGKCILYINLTCLCVWVSVCLFVFNKRQNGWTDRAQFFYGTSCDHWEGLRMIKIKKMCLKVFNFVKKKLNS